MNEIKALETNLMPNILIKNCLVLRCKKQEKFNKKYQLVNEQYTYNGGFLLSCYEERKMRETQAQLS